MRLALLVLAGACQDPALQDDAAMPAASTALAPASATALAAPALPAEGSWSLSRSDAGLTLIARGAPRGEALRALAQSEGFELVVLERWSLAGLSNHELRDASLGDVLGALLADLPHSLHYGVGPNRERDLERVVVGQLPDVAAAPPAEPAARPKPRQRPRRAIPLAVRDPVGFEERQLSRRAELESEDPRVRLEAAQWIYADDMGVAVLDDVVRYDPDARVRVRAAATLGEADRDGRDAALNALLAAVQDPQSQVVLAALESIESLGDETLIPELTPLLDHPSVEVRERAQELIEWLE